MVKWRGLGVYCLKLQNDKVSCTYGGGQQTISNMTLFLHKWPHLAYRLKIPQAKNRPLHYNMICCKRIVFLHSRCRTFFTTAYSSRYLQFFTSYAKHNHKMTQRQWAPSCLYDSISLKTNDLIQVRQTFRGALRVYYRIVKQICFAEQNNCTSVSYS